MPKHRYVAEVIVDVPSRQLDKVFDYEIPTALTADITTGSVVYVPFGRRRCPGYVVGVRLLDMEINRSLKFIIECVRTAPVLSCETLQLTDWLTERTACTRLQAIHAVVPNAFRVQSSKLYRGVETYTETDALSTDAVKLWTRLCKTPKTEEQIYRLYGDGARIHLNQLVAAGAVENVDSVRTQVRGKVSWNLRRVVEKSLLRKAWEHRRNRAPKQAKILERLLTLDEISLSELAILPSDASVIALEKAGLVMRFEAEVGRSVVHQGVGEQFVSRSLTRWQQSALESIRQSIVQRKPSRMVLHGVTGSGKTEVYLNAIASVLSEGGTAIVLVPEIALTPQMVGRFLNRFGNNVAVLHSGLTTAERREEWLRIESGVAPVVIGARSAIFAPVTNLRLVIVDEEHETSYKQDESPRYDAREVANWRSDYHGAVVVYGSATPSLVTMHQVELGLANILTLPVRANGRPLPSVTVVDMREELRAGNRTLFSRVLAEGVDAALQQHKQSILFLNRRGFAAFVLCRNCGETVMCPRCDISLTMHKHNQISELRCHYCEFVAQWTAECPTCKELSLRPFGIGTQQVEAALLEKWPTVRVLRMDVDTTRQRGAHQRAIARFLQRDADILVGTQMIAKGLDFPDVTFVGVIAADTMLSVPDYRSSERTFQLLTQVAGRAGRAMDKGSTVIQTYRPTHYAVVAAAHHDYSSFYREERGLRNAFSYPPFCELSVLQTSHANESLAKGAASRFERELQRSGLSHKIVVLPATASGIPRVEDKYRYQVVVKYESWSDVRESVVAAFRLVQTKLDKYGGRCTLDVNAGRIG